MGSVRRLIGSWYLFSDIAGQVSRSSLNPIITVATVAVPRERVPRIRRSLLEGLQGAPVKWKLGKLGGLRVVMDLVARERLDVGLLQIHCGDPKRLEAFYAEADRFFEAAAHNVGKKLSYLSGDTALRMSLFGRSPASVIGRILRARHPWGDRLAEIRLEWVIDSDLPTAADRAQFAESISGWSPKSRLISDLGVRPVAKARTQTEQEEPLLLLADYVAGVYHHADPRAKLDMPVVTREAASEAVQDLREKAGARLYEEPQEFTERYPLVMHQGHVLPRYKADELGLE